MPCWCYKTLYALSWPNWTQRKPGCRTWPLPWRMLHVAWVNWPGVSRKRIDAAKKLTTQVTKELSALRMERTRFAVEVLPLPGETSYGQMGHDAVEFVFSANPGEPLKPLAKVASGGTVPCHVGVENHSGRERSSSRADF